MTYKQVKAEDGTVSYVEMTEEDLDGVVKTSQRYKDIKNEAINNRKEAKTFKEQLEALNEKSKEPTPETKPETKPETPTLDEDALYKKFAEQFKAEQAAEQKAKSDRDEMIKKLMKDNNLTGDDFYQAISDSANPETTAKLLSRGRFNYQDAPTNPSDDRLVKEDDPLRKKIHERMYNR